MRVLGNGVDGILQAMGRLGSTMGATLEVRLQRLRAAIHQEVQRTAATLALAVAAAALSVATLLFAAVAIMIATWGTHPVLAASLISLSFAMLALIAALILRSADH